MRMHLIQSFPEERGKDAPYRMVPIKEVSIHWGEGFPMVYKLTVEKTSVVGKGEGRGA